MHILGEIERFLYKHNMPKTTFGRESVSDPCLVDDLRRGRQPRDTTLKRIRDFMLFYEDEQENLI